MILFISYLIAGADVHAPFQIFQNFVNVPCPRRSQETGVTVRLEETEEKHIFKNSPHYCPNHIRILSLAVRWNHNPVIRAE